jgi:hypothetical protein
MLWVEAWGQIPMCTFPPDDGAIAAIIGMPVTTFAAVREMLMRGWAPRSDGRLYHPFMTQLVNEMLAGRKAYRVRQAKHRAVVTPRSRVTKRESRPNDVDLDLDVDGVSKNIKQPSPAAPGEFALTGQIPERREATRASRIDENMVLPDEWRDWAVQVFKLNPHQVGRLFVRWRDYWSGVPGKDGLRTNWFGVWKNRCRKEYPNA